MPDELRDLWRWHDGIDGYAYITSGDQFISAQEAVDASMLLVEIVRDAGDGSIEGATTPEQRALGWPGAQLMVFAGAGSLFIGADCTKERESAALRIYDAHSDACPLISRSLVDAVSRITVYVEQGHQRWDIAEGRWIESGPELWSYLPDES